MAIVTFTNGETVKVEQQIGIPCNRVVDWPEDVVSVKWEDGEAEPGMTVYPDRSVTFRGSILVRFGCMIAGSMVYKTIMAARVAQ